ncbi:TolC family protein [Brucella intermedia]|nr:TolC family protein [Brucella intermedia]
MRNGIELGSCVLILVLATSLTGCNSLNSPNRSSATVVGKAVTDSRPEINKKEPEPVEPVLKKVPLNGLSLVDAVGVAIARHPDISRAKAVVAQSRSQIAVEKAAWYPTLEYGVRPGYGDSYGSGGSSLEGRASVGVNQLVYDFGRTSGKIAAADAGLLKQEHSLADTIENVAFRTASTFVNLAASQEMMAAARKQVSALIESKNKIDERVKAGLSDVSDLKQAEVAIERAKAEELTAKTKFDVAAGELAELTGVRPQQVAGLDATKKFVTKLKPGNGIDDAPSVLAAAAEMDAANARVKIAKAERYPSVGLSASKSVSTGSQNASDDMFVGLSLSGSFSTGGLDRHRIEAAEAERRAAAETLENHKMTIRSTLNSAQTEAAGANARLSSYESVIKLSQASRDLYWQEYTLDKRPLTDVINAEKDIYSSQMERINAQSDSVLANIRSLAAVGVLVEKLKEQTR